MSESAAEAYDVASLAAQLSCAPGVEVPSRCFRRRLLRIDML